MSQREVIVVGAGVCGLTAAYTLQKQGVRVRVLEAEDHVGGKTTAVRRDGFQLNTGATLLAGGYATMVEVAKELGIADRLGPFNEPIGIVKDGEVHRLRIDPVGGLVDFART